MTSINISVHVYREKDPDKYNSTSHYELVYVEGEKMLSDKINVSKDRGYARSKPISWLKLHNGKKWTQNATGMFSTSAGENVLFGDLNNRKHMVLFEYTEPSENPSELIVYCYKNYYPFPKWMRPENIGKKINKILRKGGKNGK